MGALYFLMEMTYLAKIFFVIGFVLVIIEMFYPGFGAPGIAGIISLLAGIFLTANNVLEAAILILIIIIILALALSIVLKSASKGRLSKTLILNDSLTSKEGFIGTEELDSFINKEGRALSTLRPSGMADFDGVKLDVVSEGEYIEKNSLVKIVKVQGRRVLVKKID